MHKSVLSYVCLEWWQCLLTSQKVLSCQWPKNRISNDQHCGWVWWRHYSRGDSRYRVHWLKLLHFFACLLTCLSFLSVPHASQHHKMSGVAITHCVTEIVLELGDTVLETNGPCAVYCLLHHSSHPKHSVPLHEKSFLINLVSLLKGECMSFYLHDSEQSNGIQAGMQYANWRETTMKCKQLQLCLVQCCHMHFITSAGLTKAVILHIHAFSYLCTAGNSVITRTISLFIEKFNHVYLHFIWRWNIYINLNHSLQNNLQVSCALYN